MEHLYEHIIDLLKTQVHEHQFESFLVEIGEQPLVEPTSDSFSRYRFLNSAFSFDVGSDGKIHSAHFPIENEAIRDGRHKPFKQLPFGINQGDRVSDIEAKLGVKPAAIHKGIHLFRMSSHILAFKFDTKTESVISLLVVKDKA